MDKFRIESELVKGLNNRGALEDLLTTRSPESFLAATETLDKNRTILLHHLYNLRRRYAVGIQEGRWFRKNLNNFAKIMVITAVVGWLHYFLMEKSVDQIYQFILSRRALKFGLHSIVLKGLLNPFTTAWWHIKGKKDFKAENEAYKDLQKDLVGQDWLNDDGDDDEEEVKKKLEKIEDDELLKEVLAEKEKPQKQK